MALFRILGWKKCNFGIFTPNPSVGPSTDRERRFRTRLFDCPPPTNRAASGGSHFVSPCLSTDVSVTRPKRHREKLDISRNSARTTRFSSDMSHNRNDCRIYVGNLPPDIRTKDIQDLFYKFGKVTFVDLKNRRGPPFAFVEFEDPRYGAFRAGI